MNIPLSEDFRLGFACGAVACCLFWIIGFVVGQSLEAGFAASRIETQMSKKQMTSDTNNLKHDTMTLP